MPFYAFLMPLCLFNAIRAHLWPSGLEIEPFSEPDGTSNETSTISIFRYCGSNETLQDILGSIVCLFCFFKEFLKYFSDFENLENCEFLCFSYNLGKIYYGGNIEWVEIATAIFWPTKPTNQSQPRAHLFNFYGFHPIVIRFVIVAKFFQRSIPKSKTGSLLYII